MLLTQKIYLWLREICPKCLNSKLWYYKSDMGQSFGNSIKNIVYILRNNVTRYWRTWKRMATSHRPIFFTIFSYIFAALSNAHARNITLLIKALIFSQFVQAWNWIKVPLGYQSTRFHRALSSNQIKSMIQHPNIQQ